MKILPLMPSRSFALHAGFARHAADQQGPVHVAESFVEAGRRDHAFEQREGAIFEFHHHALQRGQGGFDLNEMQDDGLIGAEHRAGSDAEKECITDLSGGAGDRDTNRCCAHNSVKVRRSMLSVQEGGKPDPERVSGAK